MIWPYDHIIISSYHHIMSEQPVFPKNRTRHFSMNLDERPGESSICKGFDINLGTIGWIRPKVASEFSNFERLKNREDSSDFDDFWTESIATTQTFFSKIFAPPKFSRRRKNSWRTNAQTNERTPRTNFRYESLLKFPGPMVFTTKQNRRRHMTQTWIRNECSVPS